jgi:hypothetical protein
MLTEARHLILKVTQRPARPQDPKERPRADRVRPFASQEEKIEPRLRDENGILPPCLARLNGCNTPRQLWRQRVAIHLMHCSGDCELDESPNGKSGRRCTS